jgi:hypothetical protein
MNRRTTAMAAMPLGLVLGGLAGLVLGQAIGEPILWMILGAGGGLAIGGAIGSAANRRT